MAGFALFRLPCDLAPDALHGIVHRFQRTITLGRDLRIGQTAEIETENPGFKGRKLAVDAIHTLLHVFLMDEQRLWIALALVDRSSLVTVGAVKKSWIKGNIAVERSMLVAGSCLNSCLLYTSALSPGEEIAGCPETWAGQEERLGYLKWLLGQCQKQLHGLSRSSKPEDAARRDTLLSAASFLKHQCLEWSHRSLTTSLGPCYNQPQMQ